MKTKPQTLREYEAAATLEIKGRWFKDHRAERHDATFPSGLPPLTVIRWKKPGTGIFGIEFIIAGRCLYVSGDLGEAVYCWSQRVTPEFLAGLNLDYFLGKCQASERGTRLMGWDDGVALNRLAEIHRETENLDVADEVTKAKKDPCRETCDTAAREVYEITGDAEEAGGISESGSVPDMRGISHWIGITEAVRQLNAPAAVPEK